MRNSLAYHIFCLVGAFFVALVHAHEVYDATTVPKSTDLESLNGSWEFQEWTNLSAAPDFADARAVTVPGHTQPGAYRREFLLRSAPTNSRIILHFAAVGYRAVVFVNGDFVGDHLGGYTPFEFDITGQCRRGENELVILVEGQSATLQDQEAGAPVAGEDGFTESGVPVNSEGAKSIIGYGYFPFEGIRNDVHLREVPLTRITDATITTSFREKKLSAEVWVANQTERTQDVTLEVEALPYDIPTRQIGSPPVWSQAKTLRLDQVSTCFRVDHAWPDPELWMLGSPRLYVLRITLRDARTKQILNTRDVRFGFREVWIEGKRLVLNGVPLRGFIHGTLDTQAPAERVRTLFADLLDYNLNMVRPSTMPPPPYFAQIADEMGIGIIGEAELTFNRNHAYDDPAFWQNFQRVWKERIRRDKNHPSILLWSLANEVIITSPDVPGLGGKFFEAYEMLKREDPTRPVMQEGDGDLRDHTAVGTGYPIDVINMHLYDVSPTKNPLWATEFPPVAWALESITEPSQIPGTMKYGVGFPDQGRPWIVGEFGPGVLIAYPDHFAFWAGSAAYRDLFGQAEPLVRAVGETMAAQIHAFRDLGMAAMDPWGITPLPWLKPYLKPAMSPVLVLARDRQGHWVGEKNASRNITVLNDSFENQILDVTARISRDGKPIAERKHRSDLAAGERHDGMVEFALPEVSERVPVEFSVEVADASGSIVSEFAQDWAIYPEIQPDRMWRAGAVRIFGDREAMENILAWTGAKLSPETQIPRLQPSKAPLVVINFWAFHAMADETKDHLASYIEAGGILLLLEADIVDFAGLSIQSNFESDSTRIFTQGTHPLTAGTTDADWEFWMPDHYVSRANYPIPFAHDIETPLVASGSGGMRFSPLLVKKHGAGAVVASRLQLERAVASEPVARQFLNNVATYPDALKAERKLGKARKVFIFGAGANPNTDADLLSKAGLAVESSATESLREPSEHILFLKGSDQPTQLELSKIHQFVRDGGKLWIHRITPKTPFLPTIRQWTRSALVLQEPDMWLHQLEIAASKSPLLDGVSNYHTCWATFAWTHGDVYSLRTTPIANFVISPPVTNADVLLSEPGWNGKWSSGPGSATLAQEIMFKIGQHQKNESPAAGLASFKLGEGEIVIDQVLWDEVTDPDMIAIPTKARHYLFTLAKNLAKPQQR